MRVQVRDAARWEVDAVAAERASRLPGRSVSSHTSARPSTRAAPKCASSRGDVVDHVVARPRLDTVRVIGEPENQWNVWPPSITIVWPVMKSEPRPAEEHDRADDVLRQLVALDRARRDRDVAQLLDHLGVRLDPGRHREARARRS